MRRKILINITLVSVILITAAVVRFGGIDKYDLWFDELITDNFSYQNLNSMARWSKMTPLNCFLEALQNDKHPPLYYGLVYGYSVFGGNGKSLRVLSAIFSFFSLVIIYFCACLLFGRKAGLYALIIMALSPFQIWYAQEARPYALSCFFSLLLIFFFLKALKTGKTKFWFYFILSAILAIYTSYYNLFLIVFSGLSLFFKVNRQHLKRWFLSITAVGVAFLPLLPLLKIQMGSLGGSFWLPPSAAHSMILTFAVFNLGYSASFLELNGALSLSCLLFSLGAFAYYRSNKEDALFLVSWFLLPVLTIYLISREFVPVFITRQLIIFTPFWYLFIAQGIVSLKNRMLRQLSIIGICLLMVSSLAGYYRGFMFISKSNLEFYAGVHKKKNYRNLLGSVFNAYKQRDAIVVSDIQSLVLTSPLRRQYKYSIDRDSCAFIFYPHALSNYERKILQIDGVIKNLPKKEQKDLYILKLPNRSAIRQIDKFEANKEYFDRLWLISSSWGTGLSLSCNSQKARAYMLRNYEKIEELQHDGIIAELFNISKKKVTQPWSH
ncbi:MAG: glycosyltransferase family 39 protein [Candidatus Omnitrophota bacterium]|jgi:hypothetical protein